MKADIAIKEADLKKVVSFLSQLLADTYLLYVKTQNFHWNVVSPLFPALHKMFEEQYEELAEAVDVIAERIRALGFPAPASFKEFLQLATLKEADKKSLTDQQMIKQLLTDHETLIVSIRENYDVTENTGDEGTADLFAQRLREHEKTAWMLRSAVH